MDNDDHHDLLLSEIVECWCWWWSEEGAFLWLEVARVATLTTEDVDVVVVPVPTLLCTMIHPFFLYVGSLCVLFNGSNIGGRDM